MKRVDNMRILVVSLLYPLPGNMARGTFVADHAQALLGDGHEVRVVNPLPRMMRYQEARRSTLTGAARAPREFEHGGSRGVRSPLHSTTRAPLAELYCPQCSKAGQKSRTMAW